MRRNRKGIPSDFKNCVLKKDEHIARYRDKIMIMKWKDKKDVIILSTIHDNKFVEMEKRRKTISKPEFIADYNKNMGGIDLTDGQMKTYEIARNQVKKYYYKIFLHALDMVCLNAYLLYKKDGSHLDRLHFLIETVEKARRLE
ncbi:piggyBac transposable element-derived protein 4-like [Stegodyphus dumicola]|uniref:piggyBac transposable element-derived protein 4-like n=1 Tax=Stegodyphus dumicola TaxID=202533 RepID=UPI0015A8487A|nr:piggyBac transposable element-derived protein 4-like [Stegodyphus dumicola]